LWANQEIRINMTKNMTRKGLAFGAGFALIASGLAGVPAQAAGIDSGSVSLLPDGGAEYTMIAGGTLKLKANMATGVRGDGQYLKFQVEDASADSTVLLAQSTQYSYATEKFAQEADDEVVTLTVATGHKFKKDDRIAVTGHDATGFGTINVASAVVTAVTATTVKYVGSAVATDVSEVADVGQIALLPSTPALGKYILDTKTDSVTGDKTIGIKSTDKNSTQTVTVTAWIDANDDGDIDTTEYQSPARTVSFVASTGITPTVSMVPAYVGETTVKAEVTFSPVLNGSQLVASYNLSTVAAAVDVQFTRPGSTKTIDAETVTYSNTTKKFTATSYAMNNTGATATDATTTGWAISQPRASLLIQSVTIKNDVVTATTSTAAYATGDVKTHGLQIGDTVAVASATTTAANKAAAVITSVPTTTTFTYKVATAGTDDVTAATQSAGTIGVTTIVRNAVVPGTYSAQALLYRYDASVTDELTKIGSVAASSVGITTADSATLEGVPSASVNAAGKVAKSATSGSVVLSVLDKDGDPVAAGVQVAITATRNTGAGTLTVNGTTLVSTTASNLTGVTDASGQVAITFGNTIGAVGDRIDLATDVQGVTDTLNVIWEAPKYSIYDSADATANSSARNRTAGADGSSSFDLWVLDQFKNYAPADIRLLATVTGRTTQTTPVTLSNGRASFTVSPDGSAITGDTTVNFNFQEQSTQGLWTTSNDSDNFTDWAGATNGDLAAVAIKFYSQTDAVNLNANAANFPSSTVADLSAEVTTLVYKANDARVTTGVAVAYTAAQKAVVSGNIANASTGAAKAGAIITISGSGLLFNVGDVWAADSITFVSGDGTFAANVVSRTAAVDKLVTITSGAATKDQKVTFTSVGAVTGYSVKLTTPATVQSGATYRVAGQILDVNGNGIAVTTAGTGTNPTLSVTYLGLGLVSGGLPTTTDKDGMFYFYVLVGSNDMGTATITASYDADGTATVSKAVTTSSTVYVGQAAPSDTKVNVGTFKGFVALYAKGYKGQKMSAIVAGKWIVVESLASDFERVVRFTGAGYTITSKIYIDGVMIGDAFTTVTK
jgi:hypothetical protein